MNSLTVFRIPSVNHLWRHSKGRHFKPKAVTDFEKAAMAQMPPQKIADKANITLSVIFHCKRDKDIDNMLKCFIDCLAKRYGFDDMKIKKLKNIEKKAVPKGIKFERIEWEFSKL